MSSFPWDETFTPFFQLNMITKINAAAGRPLVPNLGPSEFRFYELDPIEEGFEADDLFDENIPRKLGRPGSKRKFKNWKRKKSQKIFYFSKKSFYKYKSLYFFHVT